jgi:hypothetical protein
MSKPEKADADIRPEYDFTPGVRGKYAERYARGTNVVVLEPDVAAAYPTAEAVNRALRERMSERGHGKTGV